MNRLILMIGLMFILGVPQVWAYPNPNRQTMWNNITDKVHTLGKTPQQAALMRKKLHRQRTLARIKSINQAKHNAWVQQQQQ